MVLLLSLSHPGRFDRTTGSVILPFAPLDLAPFSSASTPRKSSSLTEHPWRAALDLS